MLDFDVAYDKLASLSEAQDIADFLINQGVKGWAESVEECPISNWMKEQTGLAIRTNHWGVCAPKVGKFRKMEGAIGNFIGMFDCLEFPELLEEPPLFFPDPQLPS